VSLTYLDRLTSKDDEALSTLSQKAHKLLGQDLFQLIGLLDANADAHGVDGTLNENLLLLITSNEDGVKQELGAGAARRQRKKKSQIQSPV
jgi:hypothetical protein